MKRLFIAAEISGEARRIALAQINNLRSAFPAVNASWVKPENLHITLKFLGGTEDALFHDLVCVLTRAVSEFGPLQLRLNGPRAFGKRVIAIDIDDRAGTIFDLQAKIDTACSQFGFPLDKRRFHPHLTVARVRDERNAKSLLDFHLSSDITKVKFVLSRIVLFESIMLRSGVFYIPLETFPLNVKI